MPVPAHKSGTMISEVTRKHLKTTTGKVYFWGCARFSYGAEENRLVVPGSFSRTFFAAFNFALHFSYAVFLVIRLLQYRYLSKGQIGERSTVFLEYACLCFLIPPFTCHLSFFLREEAVATFVNQYLAYYRNIEGFIYCNFIV